ncbi:MAG: hypothetical protein ABW122_08940 [Ilumatobacteraceae bacterium]
MQVELYDTDLGVLELGCDPYVVTSMQVGSPDVREVTRNRVLADGTLDDTRYLGSRAITLSIRFNDLATCGTEARDMQHLIDALTPFMSPRRRPTLTWQLPNSTGLRAAIVRGVNWGWAVQGPKAQGIAPQWVVPSGEILAGGPDAQRCETIKPSTDTEQGRTYDLTFDRVYPASSPIGSRSVTNPGTGLAHWVLTIYGPVVNPIFTIHGVPFETDRLGGVSLVAGQTLVVNTRSRTVLLNGVAGASRYQNVNYDEWSWDDLLLRPGSNLVRFDGTGLTVQSAAELCFTPTYL